VMLNPEISTAHAVFQGLGSDLRRREGPYRVRHNLEVQGTEGDVRQHLRVAQLGTPPAPGGLVSVSCRSLPLIALVVSAAAISPRPVISGSRPSPPLLSQPEFSA
jgi:hypothetical protein